MEISNVGVHLYLYLYGTCILQFSCRVIVRADSCTFSFMVGYTWKSSENLTVVALMFLVRAPSCVSI